MSSRDAAVAQKQQQQQHQQRQQQQQQQQRPETPAARSPALLASAPSIASPWGSRSSTPKPGSGGASGDERKRERAGNGSATAAAPGLGTQRGGDHAVSHRHRPSLKNYPRDCPPLHVQWFHAVDVPKRKPRLEPAGPPPGSDKPPPAPKKFVPFSKGDSRAIESAFQKLADDEDAIVRERQLLGGGGDLGTMSLRDKRRSWNGPLHGGSRGGLPVKVPVNEDYLFDVDVDKRELGPAYWLGPIYEVRRGTWFYPEGSTLRPCDENLATQLEEGYLKVRPWRFAQPEQQRPAEWPRPRPTSMPPSGDFTRSARAAAGGSVTPKSSNESLRARKPDQQSDTSGSATPPPSKTYRLFGAHMNTTVTYQDGSTAWLMTDDFLSRMSSTMYQRFAGGAHYAGVKVVRGYFPPQRKAEAKDKEAKGGGATTETRARPESDAESEKGEGLDATQEGRRLALERQVSSLVEPSGAEDTEQREEAIRKRDEKEIQDDYKEQDGEEQGREIEHLLLVTHGIGQRLGLRMESVNFVHDVNTFRKTLKSVYSRSADLQALNSEVDRLPKNCRVQVLPICWRHLLDFPKQSLRHARREHDLADADFGDDDEYPNLDDLTIDGVPAVRNLITDLFMDILLYQSPAYKSHISRIVARECNSTYRHFRERNPSFKGKVSLVGHSLGSAVMFDILCRQADPTPKSNRRLSGRHPSSASSARRGDAAAAAADDDGLRLDFDVEDFYAIGSPIGLFQMLKGRTIAGRASRDPSEPLPPDTPDDLGAPAADPFLAPPRSITHSSSTTTASAAAAAAAASTARSGAGAASTATSSPKCAQIFNVFHPTDPISYRLEPLISGAMSALKPQPLPYTKRGIFGAPVGQGLTGIGARVSQSVSGLWSNLSTGIASSLLNRSLGLSAEDAAKLRDQQGQGAQAQQEQQFQRAPLSAAAGTNVGAGVASPPGAAGPGFPTAADILADEERRRKLAQQAIAPGEAGEHPPTLIDAELETLYAGFQKRRRSGAQQGGMEGSGGGKEWREAEERGRKLRREEQKVRALNSNGRVDYSIQEGAFDISLLASIASHLSYWADEDVSHFIISQLLSRHRVIKRGAAATGEHSGPSPSDHSK
ncbi:DDHD domain-containing protein [Lineolata rhizophorae]|uniref:DDHD domain-containing protein n=1 Tax=Lineolata rhizophorae TaxID=578093 RepID=A0A6A6NKL7_9PEZI|nr:DDHD domain-containing protein [Lineolata rhizophorae]